MLPALLFVCLLPSWGFTRTWVQGGLPNTGEAGALHNATGCNPPLRQGAFRRFIHSYGRQYRPGSHEYRQRKQRFRESIQRQKHLNFISSSSSGNNTAFYGINQFSDLSPEEFEATFLRSFLPKVPIVSTYTENATKQTPLPTRFDWRDKNVVTPMKDQKSCGGCWAFSTVEAVESVHAIQGQSLEELSVQQVIDCSDKNFGCNGGSPVGALAWLNQTQVKLVRNSEYSYKAQDGMCHYFPRSQFGVSIKGFEAYNFRGYEEDMMRKLVDLGPLIGVVDAISWQDYLGGIIQHHCSSGESNHAVVITGFDKTGDTPYWIVRNSWGASWGIDGYVFVKIGGNVCGIADSVSATFM